MAYKYATKSDIPLKSEESRGETFVWLGKQRFLGKKFQHQFLEIVFGVL